MCTLKRAYFSLSNQNYTIQIITFNFKSLNFFFSEADATKAMTKDRQNMQHRYIELFNDGAGGRKGRAGGGGGFGNRGGKFRGKSIKTNCYSDVSG